MKPPYLKHLASAVAIGTLAAAACSDAANAVDEPNQPDAGDASTRGAAPDAGDTESGANIGLAPENDSGNSSGSIQIEAGEYVFDALAAGPEGGELVLLLHGFPQTSYEWRGQVAALADAGYRAVAPDQRGYSPGARPTDVDSYHVALLVGDALAMVDALGYDAFHVVGHDWGGAVAWGLAAFASDRVKTLTAVSTPHPTALRNALADPESCQSSASAYFEALSGPDSSVDDLAGIGVGFDGLSNDAVTEYLEKVISQPDVLDLALNWYRANVSDGMLTATAGSIAVPTMYLWGTEDAAFCEETAEDTANHVSGEYRFVAVEGGGHWLPETESETVTQELLEWLEGN